MKPIYIYISIFLGLSGNFIMSQIGMVHGLAGIDYYAEVHTTSLNKFIHFLCMPFTIYGILLTFPTLIFYYHKNANFINTFKKMIFITFISHYVTINIFGGILTGLFFYPSFYYSLVKTNQKQKNIIKGLKVMTIALLIQEVFGHWISGDPPSRLEAVPNAIVYSTYFAINKLFT